MATKSIKGTQTEKNVMNAFLSESSAYTSYTFFAQLAQKEGYYPIAQVLNETAANELHHCKVYFKMLECGTVDVPMSVNPGTYTSTVEALKAAIAEEEAEAQSYRDFGATARDEGFDEIADHFYAIATVEEHHCFRFKEWLKHVEAGTVWKRENPIKWRCMVCGYIYEGTEPPTVCPGCDHPYQHYFPMDMLEL